MGKQNVEGNLQYLIFVCLFYFYIMRDWLERKIPAAGYGDEVIALLAIPIFFYELKKNRFDLVIRREGYGKYIVLFLLTGFLGNAAYRYQNLVETALPDMFLCIKFWLTLYVGRHLFSQMPLEEYAPKIYNHIKLVALTYCGCYLLDLRFHIFWASLRYGMRSTQLMYSHSTVFAACCIFLIVVLLSLTDYIAGWEKWLLILLFLMCTTLRSKAWGAAIAILLICYFVFYREKKVRIRTLLLFVPLIVAVAWEQIEFYFFSSIQGDSARYQLLIKSLEIAKDHFPLGAGFGTFGSYYSGRVYSPLYFIYGLTMVHGLTVRDTSFMSDSFWPMVIGQTGFIGTLAFALAIMGLFREIQKVRINSPALYASALSGLSYLLIISVAESAFVHPVAAPIAMWMGYVLNPNVDIGDGYNESLSERFRKDKVWYE